FGGHRYLMRNMPAIDLLNTTNNEGAAYEEDLVLLFAVSGDLRNVIKSILGLPEEYKGKCSIIMNDYDIHIVARNTIILLTALKFEPETAVPMTIHIWCRHVRPCRGTRSASALDLESMGMQL
ncbi:hypothetical protein K469DRAFT_553355, partial [Zopfia rhizophila CBS 207.26]